MMKVIIKVKIVEFKPVNLKTIKIQSQIQNYLKLLNKIKKLLVWMNLKDMQPIR